MRPRVCFGIVLLALSPQLGIFAQEKSAGQRATSICAQVDVIRKDLSEMLHRYSEKHPTVIALRREIDRLLEAEKNARPDAPSSEICPIKNNR